jgi:hypothetical protein
MLPSSVAKVPSIWVRPRWVRGWVRTGVNDGTVSHPSTTECRLFKQVVDGCLVGRLPHNPLAVGSSPTRPTLDDQPERFRQDHQIWVGCEGGGRHGLGSQFRFWLAPSLAVGVSVGRCGLAGGMFSEACCSALEKPTGELNVKRVELCRSLSMEAEFKPAIVAGRRSCRHG